MEAISIIKEENGNNMIMHRKSFSSKTIYKTLISSNSSSFIEFRLFIIQKL
jgi:hypothetical protein